MKLSAKITTAALSAVFMASAFAVPAFAASCGNSNMPWRGNQDCSDRNHDKNYSHRSHDRGQNCGDRSDYGYGRPNYSNCWRCQEAKKDLLRALMSNDSQHEKREAWQKYFRITKFLNCDECNKGCDR